MSGLGVNFAWHVHPWEDLLALVKRAEALGYAAAFPDGDIAMLTDRRDADVLDGWTVTTSLLARTRRIQIGSIRLVHHWNAARLAQSVATAERLTPGRLRFLVTIGDRPGDERFGYPVSPVAERIEWLDETLTALRALWRGDTVTLRGRHVELEEARIRPTPAGGHIPVGIAGAGTRMLELVAAHADLWDINLPPVPARVRDADARLERVCRRLDRDPASIERSMLLFARLARSGSASDRAGALAEYRRLNPWFRDVPDEEIEPGLVAGTPAQCREQLEKMTRELRIDFPVLDLSGLPLEPTLETLEALAPTAG